MFVGWLGGYGVGCELVVVVGFGWGCGVMWDRGVGWGAAGGFMFLGAGG